MGRDLKLAIVGAGVMGRNYLRAARAAGIPITGIFDLNTEQAQSAAAEYDCTALNDLSAVDAAVIAVPTAAHANTALPLLQKGVHCLVEKPFADTEAECRQLRDTAAIAGCVLQVGHIERFNPAIEQLLEREIEPGDIKVLTARRMGPASARVTDVSVIVDLMVHDLDVVLALKRAPVTSVVAAGTRDHAEAKLTFADGAVATLTASRIHPERVRDLSVVTDDGEHRVDYIAKSYAGAHEMPVVYTGDALGAELAHFIGCIHGKLRPRVDGAAGLAAMQLAWRIEAALKGN